VITAQSKTRIKKFLEGDGGGLVPDGRNARSGIQGGQAVSPSGWMLEEALKLEKKKGYPTLLSK